MLLVPDDAKESILQDDFFGYEEANACHINIKRYFIKFLNYYAI